MVKKSIEIAFASIYDINPNIWSGTVSSMVQGLLRSGNKIAFADNFQIPLKYYFQAKSFIHRKFLKSFYFKEREPIILKHYAKHFKKKFVKNDYDLVFSPQTSELQYIETTKPIVFWVDATFYELQQYLQKNSSISSRDIDLGNNCDKIAYERSRYAIFSSDWAAQSAISHYGIQPEKVRMIPFGANININHTYQDVKIKIKQRFPAKVIKLLFIGIEWERKGGDIAVEVVRKLNEMGYPAELNVVGCIPKFEGTIPDFIKVHGFVNKNTIEGIEKLNNLLFETHFFIMLSHFEPFGIVYCEANAFGVPNLGNAVCGVPTIIKNDLNGYIFKNPINSIQIVEKIVEVMSKPEKYEELAQSSFNEYLTRLNWDVSIKKLNDIFTEILS